MRVRELLDAKGKTIISIDANKSVEDVIQLMFANKVSAIMVTEGGKTVGIFTERDVVRTYMAKGGRRFREIPVKEGMVTDLVVAVPDDDLSDVMASMVDRNIRHLPVVSHGTVIGMLSIRDIVQTQVKKLHSEIHYLKDYISR